MVRCRHRQELAVGSHHNARPTSPGRSSVTPGRLGAFCRKFSTSSPALKHWRDPGVRLAAALLAFFTLSSVAMAQAEPAQTSQTAQPSAQAAQPSSSAAVTQSTPANAPPTGFTGFVEAQGGANLVGTVLMFDADLGYGLSEHLSVDIGVPVIFSRNPFSPVKTHDYYWSALLGEPYLDAKYTGVYHNVNYTSVLTGTGPVANEDKIFSTGRFGVDLFNHLDEQIGSISPFLNVEVSNGAINRFIMPRPFEEARMYQSLGILGDLEAGFEYKVNNRFVRGVNVGASAYVQGGGGPQKMFSRLVFPYSSLAGDGRHDRYWDSSFETKGTSALTRDNGWSGWVDMKPLPNLNIQLAYTRSVHYDMDIYTAMFNFDASQWVKTLFRRR